MTVVAEREQETSAEPLPEVTRLNERQLLGIDCARCGRHLGMDARRLGDVADHGYSLRLYASTPACPTVPLPRRQRFHAWPPGAPPRPTRPPP